MFITSEVDLPDELITPRNRDLVLFVGAGVSVDPPSSLPTFQALTVQIASSFGEDPTTPQAASLIRTNPDRYLGQLESQGLQVHEQVKRIIGNPESKLNELHRSLVRLVRDPASLRIVTTNYDDHIARAARDHFGGEIPVYFSPALPMGNDFNGIVHLHGSVSQESRHLIATDSDFGRAYLTDAWAARFLYEMYRTFTVLFLGYSHSDWMMDYLARGLSSDAHRYAIVPSDSQTDWANLRITGIPYPVVDGNHVAFEEVLVQWSQDTQDGLLEREARLRLILSSPPSLDRVQLDYVRRFLMDPVLGPVFCKHARGVEWLNWLLDIPEFNQLFEPSVPETSKAAHLAWWFAENFVDGASDDGYDAVTRLGGQPSNELWAAIASFISRDEFPGGEVRGKWIALLLETAQGRPFISSSLTSMARACNWADDRTSLLLLIETMMTPHLVLSGAGGFLGSCDLLGDHHFLRELWPARFVPSLGDSCQYLAPVLFSHLGTLYTKLQLIGRAGSEWDPVSYRRSAIEPHPQDAHRDGIDSLIAAARDVLIALHNTHPETADGYLLFLAQSEAPLLRRLAAHLYSLRTDLTPDDKISWLLQQGWLFAFSTKHEVFQLLASAWAGASDETKRELLAEVKTRFAEVAPTTEITPIYEVYNLTVWLANIDPSWAEMVQFRDELAEEYEFEPREHPDFDSWIGPVTAGPPSGAIGADEVLALTPARAVDWLKRRKQLATDNSWGDKYSVAIATFGRAATENPEWALAVMKRLVKREAWDDDAWEPTLTGLTIGIPDIPNLDIAVETFILHGNAILIRRSVARFLERIPIERFTDSLTERVKLLCRKLWTLPDDIQAQADDMSLGWLNVAISDWSGQIALIWLRQLSSVFSAATDEWNGLDDENSSMLGAMITGEARKNQLARSVIASQLHFLNAVDRPWTREEILPLFDWERDRSVAEQAWDGFLSWGQHDQSYVKDLLPNYLRGFAYLPLRQKRLCEHLALVALYSPVATPEAGGWLDSLVTQPDASVRSDWAQSVGSYLAQGDITFADGAWERWLEKYWCRRLENLPLAIDPHEGAEMLSWVGQFNNHFGDACVLMALTPVENVPGWRLHKLLERVTPASEMDSLARLLAHVLVRVDATSFYDVAALRTAVAAFKDSGLVEMDVLRRVCAGALSLGVTDASDWLN